MANNYKTNLSKQRFAFYTTIPLFLLQLLLFGLAIISRMHGYDRAKSLHAANTAEKGQSQHELNAVRQLSLETKSDGSPENVHQVQMGTKGVAVV